MAATAALLASEKLIRGMRVHFQVTLSGSYSTGGDSLDLAPLNRISANKQPTGRVSVAGVTGFVFRYDLANKKLKVYGQEPTSATAGVISLSELAAGAYPASLTSDVIHGAATFII